MQTRIYLFGAGRILMEHAEQIRSLPDTVVIGVLDNDPGLQGREVCSYPVICPQNLRGTYDYIVITSAYVVEMRRQLLEMCVPENRIRSLWEYLWMLYGSRETVSLEGPSEFRGKPGVALVGLELDFHGACIAGLHALEAFGEMGYRTGLFVYDLADSRVLDYAAKRKIAVHVCPGLRSEQAEPPERLREYELGIINTFKYPFCRMASVFRRSIFWLHDSEEAYIEDQRLWGRLHAEELYRRGVYCVSAVAADTFRRYYPNVPSRILEYGLPDEVFPARTQGGKLVFAVIGNIVRIKGHDVLLEAIRLLPWNVLEQCEFWIIGKRREKTYYENLLGRANGIPVQFFPDMTHDDIIGLYAKIDVLISCSRMDSLPIVVTEAMMNRKACIISDSIGMMRYIQSGRDALTFRTENAADLADKIRYAVEHRERLAEFGVSAREVYERVFSMRAFSERLSRALLET